jgi:hypothetical protein
MPIGMLLVSVATSTALLVGGLTYFERAERKFADLI